MRRPTLSITALAIAASACAPTPATVAPAPAASPTQAAASPARSIAAATAGMTSRDGFIPVHFDTRQGKILLELPGDSTRALLFFTLATGLGSNPVGLDRGSSMGSQVVRFQRNGDRVLAIFENWSYRTSADDPAHARTVDESFPVSTIAALPLAGSERGRLLVDATEFIFRDWLDIAGTLSRANQGSYSLARDRSMVHEPYTMAFPDNTEIDVSVTFALSRGQAGGIVRTVAPDARAITLRQHLTLLRLPDDDYRPRAADPRAGFFSLGFRDYAQPIDGWLEQRWISRHRLEREDPADPSSPIREPIVFYVDRGIPEPMRTATLEGVRFWERAFDLAGLRGAFRAELLPEGVDPMDARYNVVQWVNRHERGWSIGGSLRDPRTGEIIKGMARMDSHRARTAYNIHAALMGAAPSPADTAFVLGRVRQVTAHEVGHTIGIAHNYIASTYERGSLMDYPPPRVRLGANGEIDLSAAYDTEPGAFDVWAVRWGYGIFPEGTEADSLNAIMRDGLRRGYLFLSDADARPDFASDPRVNLWDDAASPGEFLRHQMVVRRVAIDRFGERNIREGEPLTLLQERFGTLYFFHRFAIGSVARTIGGMEYSFAHRGDGLVATRLIPPSRQRQALSLLLTALRPEELAIPDSVLALMAPRPYGVPQTAEMFGGRTRPAFDELEAARTLAHMVIDAILQRERAARLVQFAPRQANALSLGEVIDSLVLATWRAPRGRTPALAAVQRAPQRALADRLILLAADEQAAPDVRAVAELKLGQLRTRARATAGTGRDDVERAHWQAIANDIDRWLEHRELPRITPPLPAPQAEPFG